jgi:hypothetical protein
MSVRRTQTPAWLSDEAIERAENLGREMMTFLVRRKRRKQADPEAKVDIGRRLKRLLASLEVEERQVSRELGKA